MDFESHRLLDVGPGQVSSERKHRGHAAVEVSLDKSLVRQPTGLGGTVVIGRRLLEAGQ